MKKNDKQALHSMKRAELAKKASDLEKGITEEMQKRMTTEVKNVRTVRELRDQLARVLTILRAKELAQKGETP